MRYYVLTLLRDTGGGSEIDRKVWFDRSDLHISRIQIYGPDEQVESDVAYSDWEPVGDSADVSTAVPSAPVIFPREISIMRPQQDYRLAITITKLSLNSDIPAERFTLLQPAGTELVQVGQAAPGNATMIGQLILRNLLHRPLRTIISILAVGG